MGGDTEINRLFLAMSTCVSDLTQSNTASEALVSTALAARYMPVPADGYGAMEKLMETAGRAASSGNAASNALAHWTAGGGIIYSILTAKSHLGFMKALVGASPVLLQTVCRALVRCLTESQAQADKYAKFRADVEASRAKRDSNFPDTIKPTLSERVSSEMSWLLSQYHNMVYDTICEVMALVPTGVSVLHTCIVDNFPHRRHPNHALRQATLHALILAQRLPPLRDRLISYLVDRSVDLDVNIALELLPDVDGEEEDAVPTEREDDEDDEDEEPTDPSNTADPDSGGISDPAVLEAVTTANKLDTLLMALFRFLHFNMCGCAGLSGRHTYEEWIAPDSSFASSSESNPGDLVTPRPDQSSVDSPASTTSNAHESSSHTGSASKVNMDLWNPETFTLDYRLEDALHLAKKLPLWTEEEGVRTLPHPILDGNEGMAANCITLSYINASTNGSIVPIPPPDTLFDCTKAFLEKNTVTGTAGVSAHHNNNASALYSRSTMRSPSPHSERLFALVLGCFERSVLLTHKSKYTQFLLFYVAGLHPAFTDRLVGRLIAQVRHQERTLLLRAFASSYLGSLLARASYVDDTTLRSALYYCAEWAHGYVDLHAAHAVHSLTHYCEAGREGLLQLKQQVDAAESQMRRRYNVRPPPGGKGIWWKIVCQKLRTMTDTSDFSGSWKVGNGTRYHDSFLQYDFMDFDDSVDYSEEPLPLPPSCLVLDPALPPLPPATLFTSFLQAAFYALCFRSAYFRKKDGGVGFLRSMRWGRLLRNRAFDPLAACGEVIGREFLRVAHALRLVTHADMACSVAYAALTNTEPSDVDSDPTGVSYDPDPVYPTSNGASYGSARTPSHAGSSANQSTVSNLYHQNHAASDWKVHAAAAQSHAHVAPNDISVLESFFPFDPYLLKDSMPFISPIYRTWQQSRLPVEGTDAWVETEGYDDTSGISDGGTYQDGSRSEDPAASWSSSESSVEDDMEVMSHDSFTTSSEDDDSDAGDSSSGESDSATSDSDDDSEEDREDSFAASKSGSSSLIQRMRAGIFSSTNPKYARRASATAGNTSISAANANTSSSRGGYAATSAFGGLSLAPGLAAMVNDVMDTEDLLADLDILPASPPYPRSAVSNANANLSDPNTSLQSLHSQSPSQSVHSPSLSPSQTSVLSSISAANSAISSTSPYSRNAGLGSGTILQAMGRPSTSPVPITARSHMESFGNRSIGSDVHLDDDTLVSPVFSSHNHTASAAHTASSMRTHSRGGTLSTFSPHYTHQHQHQQSSQGTTPLLQAASAPWLLPPLPGGTLPSTGTSPASAPTSSILRSRGSSIGSPFLGPAVAGSGVPGFEANNGLKRPRRPSLASPLQGPLRSAGLHAIHQDGGNLPPTISLGESAGRIRSLQAGNTKGELRAFRLGGDGDKSGGMSGFGSGNTVRGLLLQGIKAGNKTPVLNALSNTRKSQDESTMGSFSLNSNHSAGQPHHRHASTDSAALEGSVPNYDELKELLTSAAGPKKLLEPKPTPQVTALSVLHPTSVHVHSNAAMSSSPRDTTSSTPAANSAAFQLDSPLDDFSLGDETSDVSTPVDIPLIRGSKPKAKRIMRGGEPANSKSRSS